MMNFTKLMVTGSFAAMGADAAAAAPKEDEVIGGHGPMSAKDLEKVKGEVQKLVSENPDLFKIPVRSHMEGPTAEGVTWRHGAPPDYTLANHSYLTGKMSTHAEGSLELVVENLVKTWEMERSHKMDPKTHQTVDQEQFRIGANNGKMFDNTEANEVGNYNVLLDGVDKKLYDTSQSWEASHDTFKGAFTTFPWEVLECFSGPPVVAFSWRHWGHFTGSYKGNKGNGELVELYGFGTARVNDKLQLCDVKVYYDAAPFLKALAGEAAASDTGPKSFFGKQTVPAVDRLDGGCPFPTANQSSSVQPNATSANDGKKKKKKSIMKRAMSFGKKKDKSNPEAKM